MGILRTDKVSGLETPTAVTGSVYFDGDARNDNLIMSADYGDLDFQNTDFTFESWVYPTDMSADRYWCSKGDGNLPGTAMDVRFDSDGQIRINFYVSSTAYSLHTNSGVLQENVWSHVAVVRNGTTFKSYVNGKETSSATHDITISDVSATFAIGILQGVGTGFKGYMSNFRFVRGKAVYIGEFTPSIYALEPIDGTVLLCCNNPDSVTAVSLAAVGTSKAITANGDVSIASTSPGLTRDFTGGTEFQGVTVFDTQGYFVPPSGTTEQRDSSGGRGIIAGTDNGIHYITISTLGNSKDFGDLTYSAPYSAGCASHTRGLVAGGFNNPTGNNTINAITISTTGNAINFGDIPQTAIYAMGGCSSSTRGLFGGGFKAPSPNADAGLLQINYVTIASLGDAQDFGDLVFGVRYPSGTSSPTRGLFAGGRDSANAPIYNRNKIDYVTIATTGDAIDFGDLTDALYSMAGTGSSTRGIFAGGYNPAGSSINVINYVTIATTGNAQDFGDLSLARGGVSASSNPTRATFAGGSNPSAQNVIDYVTIQSTGNALNFGDLYSTRYAAAGFSNSHGGLS
mgnify:CR=1 FL=1